MAKTSAGLLLYRRKQARVEVLLVHPGGPFWSKKDDGAWSIPKGEFTEGEVPLAAAQREFQEETGLTVSGEFQALTPIRQSGGKIVHAWTVESDLDASAIRSNLFSMEWPMGSGKMKEFPEIDRADWFTLGIAETKILKSQLPLIAQLRSLIGE